MNMQRTLGSVCFSLLKGPERRPAKMCSSMRLRFRAFSNSRLDASHTLHDEKRSETAKEIAKNIKHGDRGALASAITLMETEHKGKKELAKRILDVILSENRANTENSIRIGISGPPGAGKSTLIETFGKFLTSQKHRVAVLAVDPSSSSTGGSLLGDKTRMPDLTKDPNAYIRPSPARGHLGGVTRSTNEAILLCEYAGYDVIIVETVGVGQSEYAVTNMTDIFVLLLPPGGGDELQGIKKGIVELADLIVITKADGDLESAAHRAQYEYTASLKYMRPVNPNWKPKVLQVSAKNKIGIDKLWDMIGRYRKATDSNFMRKRSEQRVIWAWTHVQDGLRELLLEDPRMKKTTEQLIDKVRIGEITPGTASDRILASVMQYMK